MCKKMIYMVSFILVLGLAGLSNAAVIGFQAESGILGADFDQPIIDSSALGSQYITIETSSGGEAPNHENRVATYTVTFQRPVRTIFTRGFFYSRCLSQCWIMTACFMVMDSG